MTSEQLPTHSSAEKTVYRLVETLASKNQGRTLWFQQMTGIGPMTTPNREEAAVFATREGAERCPAMFHALSFYEVAEEVR